jgi:hypothetical protein
MYFFTQGFGWFGGYCWLIMVFLFPAKYVGEWSSMSNESMKYVSISNLKRILGMCYVGYKLQSIPKHFTFVFN